MKDAIISKATSTGTFKGWTLRGPAGEAKVSGALQDYQDSTKKLKERFTADYSASAEVATVLKQSTAIDTFMRAQPSSMKGRSEWDHQVARTSPIWQRRTPARSPWRRARRSAA